MLCGGRGNRGHAAGPHTRRGVTVAGPNAGPNGGNGPSQRRVGLFSNASMILSTVRGYGFTLQPDRPATIVDAALLASLKRRNTLCFCFHAFHPFCL